MAFNEVPESSTGDQPVMYYAIRVQGRLRDMDWAGWFGGLKIEVDEAQGVTCLSGPVADQAELYGLLSRLRNVGMALVSIEPIRGEDQGRCPSP